MTELEKSIEKKITVMVKHHGGLCLKWVCPGWAGVPDRIILLPVGRIIFAEVKRPKGGKVSELQKWWSERIKGLGFSYWTIWDEYSLEVFRRSELIEQGKKQEDPI